MPIRSTSVTVTTTNTLLLDESRGRRMVVFSNETGHQLHIGGSTMTGTDGIPLDHKDRLIIQQGHENDFTPSQAWYGRTDSASGPCIVTWATEDSTD